MKTSIAVRKPTLGKINRHELPPALGRTEFDLDRSFEVQLGQSTWTTVPPQGLLTGRQPLRTIVAKPHSWLVVQRDSLSRSMMLELTVTPSARDDILQVELLRSSGRSMASGTLTLDGDDLRFEITAHGVTQPKPGTKPPVVTGRLTKAGKLELNFPSS